MKTLVAIALSAVLLVSGCGAGVGQGSNATQAVPGAQGPPGDSSVLSWGLFSGLSPARVVSSGGPIGVQAITRLSEGVYEVIYNVRTTDVGVVAMSATGDGFELSDGLNAVTILGAVQDANRTNLTISVVSVISLIDPGGLGISLVDDDAIFSLVVFGELR